MATFRILAVDGGGIRGIIPAIFLARIAEKLKVSSLDKHFDFVAGTSTGSAVAASIATGQEIDECIDLYKTFGPKIFPPISAGKREKKWLDFFKLEPSYEEEPLSSAFQKLFGINTKLSDASVPLLISSYDVLQRQIFLMKSYDSDLAEVPLWEACKASCSAPTYFPAHVLNLEGLKRPLIDGGVYCNNPSMIALSEVINKVGKDGIRGFHQDNKIVLISVGTGSLLRKISIQEATTWGPIRWVRPLIDVILDASSEASHLSAKHIVTSENYTRVQVDLSDVNDDLDDASLENITSLETLARAYVQSDEGSQVVDRVIKLLKNDD